MEILRSLRNVATNPLKRDYHNYMNIPFTKMHGLGNDYIYFNCIENPSLISEPEKYARELSPRHISIGGDGIVLILPSINDDYRMRMFNADGSEAQMCGNALRCIAKYLVDAQYIKSDTLSIETNAGSKHIALALDEKGGFISARVNMGIPTYELKTITLDDTTTYTLHCVDMGNPHAVIFVDTITDDQVLIHGAEIENAALFPERTNVEFVTVLSATHIKMRVWERGSGETLACGTGACAAAVACISTNRTATTLEVELRGGSLSLEWADAKHVYMSGPATTVFTGSISI